MELSTWITSKNLSAVKISLSLFFFFFCSKKISLVFTVVRANTLLFLIETRSNPEKMMGLFQTSSSRKTQLHLKMDVFRESENVLFYRREFVEILRTNIFHCFSWFSLYWTCRLDRDLTKSFYQIVMSFCHQYAMNNWEGFHESILSTGLRVVSTSKTPFVGYVKKLPTNSF